MDGDTTLNEEGVTLYRFSRLERETATAAKIRAGGGVDMRLGGVLFDTA